MFRGVLQGMVAGAAGTTALNAATYADMSLRGRPASETPQKAVEELTDKAGHDVPGQGETRENRVEGMSALSGIVTGVGMGAAAGLFAPVLTRMPTGVTALLLGAGAMAGSNVPMTQLGVTDPKSWSAQDWLADAVPHLAFGAVTAWALKAMRR